MLRWSRAQAALIKGSRAARAGCQQDRSDLPSHLLRLEERELMDREKRAAERQVTNFNFPAIKTIDTRTLSPQPSFDEILIRELLPGEYPDASSFQFSKQREIIDKGFICCMTSYHKLKFLKHPMRSVRGSY